MKKKIIGIALAAALAIGNMPLGVAAEEMLLDCTSAQYTEIGTGFYDSSLKDESEKGTRASFDSGCQIVYTPQIPADGNYEVFYYNTANMSNSAKQEFSIVSTKGEETLTLNLKSRAGWRTLGVFNFKAGTEGTITLTKGERGGGIRSGALKIVATTQEAKVAESDKEAGADLSGIVVTCQSEGYKEENGQFFPSSLLDCTGKQSRYTNETGAITTYTPTLEEAGEYEVSYYVINNTGNDKKQKIIVNYDGGTKEFEVDCTVEDGWYSLGTFKFKAGTEGSVQAVTNQGFTRSGGVKFEKK